MLVTVRAEGFTAEEEERRVEIEKDIKNSTRHIPNYVRYDVLLTKEEDKYISEIEIKTLGKVSKSRAEGDTINLAVANASKSIMQGVKKPKPKKK